MRTIPKVEGQYVCCDDRTENKALEKRPSSKAWELNITMEFTGRATTPKRNYLAELGFATQSNRGRAVLPHAKVSKGIRYLLWREVFITVTSLD